MIRTDSSPSIARSRAGSVWFGVRLPPQRSGSDDAQPHDYGRIAGNEVLTPANLIDHVSANPAAGELVAELMATARGQLEQFRPLLAMIAGAEPTDDQLDKVTSVLTQRLGDLVPQARGWTQPCGVSTVTTSTRRRVR